MIVGFDGTALGFSFNCGVRRYARELVSAIARVDKTNKYVIFSSKKIDIPKSKNFKLVLLPKFPPFLKRQLLLANLVKKERLDVFHYLDPFGSVLFKNFNIVTTVHDINLDIVYPKSRSPLYFMKRYYLEVTRYFVAKYTKHFITVSDFSRNELRRYLRKTNIKNKEATFIYMAYSREFKRLVAPKRNYFLCMGDFSPRKNIETVFGAFTLLPDEVKSKYSIRLVVSTQKEVGRFRGIIENFGLTKHVRLEANITNTRLCRLYNQALAFLYPSVYEGFGFPILEAMACGCPVITSDFGVMKEIAGQAALLVNSHSQEAVRDALIKIIGSKLVRQKLIKLGHSRARQFSWDKAARQTILVYRELYEKYTNGQRLK